MRPMAVTWVCAYYDIYLKTGPNHKKRGLDCRAREALFAIITTTILETSVFETPPYQKRVNFDHCNIASKHKEQTHTHTNLERRNDEPHPMSMLLRLNYSQSANQMLVLFWTPLRKFITNSLIEFTHFFNSVPRVYCHRSHIAT